MFSRHKKGFTLIELLVVVSIISLLSSVVFAALNGARAKARDARRIADLNQLKIALELYYDTNGFYPQSACGWDCNNYRVSNDATSWGLLQADLAPYMPRLPVDPINSGASAGPWNPGVYSYSYGNVFRTNKPDQYDLTALLEDTGSKLRCGVKNYRWYFNNANPWCTSFGGAYSDQLYEASN